jgi:hypothetical protein
MTDRNLLAGISGLGYEVWQMTLAAGRLPAQSPPMARVADGVAQNAALESALIHARSLIEFMLDPGKYEDDMRPDDFYPNWPGPPEEVRSQLDADRKLLNKFLVHLTWERVTDEAPEWDARHTVRTIVGQLDGYANHLSAGAERREVDGAVVRSFRAHLLWARQEMAKWDQPVLSARAPSTGVTRTGPLVVTTSGVAKQDEKPSPPAVEPTTRPVATESSRGWRHALHWICRR